MTRLLHKLHQKLPGHKHDEDDLQGCHGSVMEHIEEPFAPPEDLKFLAEGTSASGRNQFAEAVAEVEDSEEGKGDQAALEMPVDGESQEHPTRGTQFIPTSDASPEIGKVTPHEPSQSGTQFQRRNA